MNKLQEIEMQTYSMSYFTVFPTVPSYFFDGEAQFEIDSVDGIRRFNSAMPFERLESTYKDEAISHDNAYSLISEERATEMTDVTVNENVLQIYQKLDFVLESMKRQKKQIKAVENKKRVIRKRKTADQLNILKQELQHIDNLDKPKMNKVAEKAGLTSGQVYKWYWDYRKRQCKQSDI